MTGALLPYASLNTNAWTLTIAGAGGTARLVERYVSELSVLRDVLVAAKVEQESVEKRLSEVWTVQRALSALRLCASSLFANQEELLLPNVQAEVENSKLRYQIAHLKRAVKECDEKLARKS